MAADTYPLRGYEYDAEGYHYGPVELPNRETLEFWMERTAKPAILQKRQVIVTDMWDFTVFLAKDGQIVWPSADGVKPEGA